ncbi:filamentous hemagglutinin N-terminal domain-containing protein [Acidiphilium sp. PA]|uniref:two-partner secretion domain-containing protein n=1 Tax=Acidiphilium sp. PA TaxID=2871705 RepID=UPI00224401F2|nr:filamentous hemagglutinin N-terminal domain-containing protein [Acidiphilium sp. PA]MCW8307684.1 filamentous hemagglutinin N-terminal domain-containing protein [Acidiphilium sp. PA]
MNEHTGDPNRALRRRLLLASTALSAALVASGSVWANPPALPANTTPQGGQVVGGQAGIAQAPGSVTITQSSDRAAINWQSFNVGSAAKVTFKQPNAQAIALNRVISNNPSIIAGRIDANGQIVLMNQSGVVFTPGSQVNAESLVVSTAGISAKNFMAGHMVFDAPPKPGARIVNDGTITMKQAGLAAFVAPQVINRGTITATLGHVILAGASTFTLDISGDGLVSIDVTQAVRKVDLGGRVVDALVTNQGLIIANGGTVTLTAQAVDGVIQQLLDVRGVVQADSVGQSKGAITIAGIGGDLQVAGSLLARGTQPGSGGGTIAVDATGAVRVAPAARIDASGSAGGGVIALGTDAARAVNGPADRTAPKARSVSIAASATIAADATQTGAGGSITLLSARRTTQNGVISAQGVGHGGVIETSSDGVIALSGTETVFAAHGHDGTILLDPATLVVGTGPTAAGTTVLGGVTTIGTDTNTISYVDPGVLNALTGTVVLTATSALSVQSAIAMADTSPVTLASGGSLVISSPVQVGGSLEIDAAGTLSIGAAVNAANITVLDPGSHGTIEIGNIVTAGTLLAMLSGGGITEASGGYVVAPTLTSAGGTVGGDVFLNDTRALGASNAIGTLGGFAATGTIAVDDRAVVDVLGTPLTITGPVNAKDATFIADGLAIDGAVSTTDTLVLDSYGAVGTTGSITQSALGVITAGTLSGAAGDVGLNNAANSIAVLENFAAGGSLALDDSASALLLDAGVGAASATINAAGITIGAPLTIAPGPGFGPLTLGSSGGISETANGGITADVLSSAGTITGGAVNLGGTNNIGELGGFTAASTFTLADTAPITIAGTLQASAATFASSRIFIDQPISVSGVLALAGSAGVDQAGNGTITAGTLTSGGITIGGIDMLLSGTANTIATLGAFATTDDFSLNDNGSPLSIAGNFTAPNASIAAPAMLFTGAATIAGQLVVASGGSIGEAGTATLAAGTFASPDTMIGGDVVLGSRFNQIGTIAALGIAGSLAVNDAAALTIYGPVRAGGISLIDAGALTLAGSLAVGTGQAIDLVAGTIVDTNAALIAPNGTIALAPFSPTTPVDFGGTSSGALAIAPSFAAALAGSGAQDIVVGQVISPGATYFADSVLTEGALPSFAGSLGIDGRTAITDTADLQARTMTLAGGSIINNGALDATALALTGTGFNGTGVVIAPDLAGSFSQGAVFDNAGNAIGLVTGLTAGGGGLLLLDSATPTIGGTIAVASGADLTVSANQITLGGGGVFSAPQGTITFEPLVAGTPIALGGAGTGTLDISAPLLAAITPGAAVLEIGNSLSGPLDVAAALSLTIPDIVLHGNGIAVNASLAVAHMLDLESTGTISQAAPIGATQLIGAANGAVLLTASNSIGTLGGFIDPNGDFDLTDNGTIVVAGPLSAANVALIAGDLALPGAITTGSLALTATDTIAGTGTLTAQTLTGTAAGLSLTGANQIGTLGTLAITDHAVFNDAAALTIAGPVGATMLALGDSGAITETGGITAATLASFNTIGGNAALTGTNSIATLGSFADAAAVTFDDRGSLSIAGPLSAASATLNTGALTEPGSITAGSFAADINGSLALTGTNSIATLGGITATGNATLIDGIAVALDGLFTAPNATITAPGIGINGGIQTSLLSLASTGSIIGAGPITAATLTGSAGPLVSLTGANAIANLGPFAGTGSMAFNDTVDLLIAGSLSAPTGLALGDAASITATGGITTGTLSSIDTIGGAVRFAGLNTIAALGDFAAAGTLSLADQSNLTLAGAVAAANTTLTTPGSITETGSLTTGSLSGSAGALELTGTNTIAALGTLGIGNALLLQDASPLTIAGPVTAGILALGDSGAITEPGSITAATLTSLGTIVGPVALTGTNTIATLGSFSAANPFVFNDTAPLTIAGPFTAPDATIAAAGLTMPGTITTDTLALLSNGAITATGPIDTATLRGRAGGALALTGANRIGSIASFAAIGDATINDTAPLTLAGPFTAPNATFTAAAIAIQGDLALRNMLALGSPGSVTENGTISAQTLTSDGLIGGSVALTGTNTIVALGDFAARDDVVLLDTAPLTIAGTLSAANATLGSDGLAIPGDIAVPGTVSIASTGSITETGTIDPALLTGSSAGAAGLTGSNVIGTLGAFSVADGAFVLNDTTSLVVTGPLTAADIALTSPGLAVPGTIMTPGTITVAGGGVSETGAVAARLIQTTGSLTGDTRLTGTNQIGTLGSFSDTGHYFSLYDARALTLIGPVTARAVTITAAGQLVLDGTAGGGLFIEGPGLTTPIAPGVQPRAGIDSVLGVTNGGAQQLLQTGTFNIDTGPIAQAAGLANQPDGVFMLLPSTGSATFADLLAPNTTLVLSLGGGMASGQMALHFLVVAGSAAGQTNFDGSLGNLSGQAAAHNGIVVPVPGTNYRFNACIIGSVNCTVLPILTLPEASPIQDYDLTPTRRRHLDRDVRLPGVAAKDY